MARDKGLEALLNDDLEGHAEITQKAMFGGWAWLWSGNLLCAAREGRMLVRLGKGNDAWALAIDGIETTVMGGRKMSGWVWLAPEIYASDALRQRLLWAAMEFVKTLPAKD